MDSELVADVVSSPRSLNWIDIADHVGYRDVGSCELLDIALVAAEIIDRCVVAHFGNFLASVFANRVVRVVANLRSFDEGQRIVEQRRQQTNQLRLGLAAEPEQNEIMSRQDRIHHLRSNGLFKTD